MDPLKKLPGLRRQTMPAAGAGVKAIESEQGLARSAAFDLDSVMLSFPNRTADTASAALQTLILTSTQINRMEVT
jgi:hypothetical protein